MTTIQLERDLATEQLFEDWRFKAREALVRGIPPEDIDFVDPYDTTTLRIEFSPDSAAPPMERTPHPEPHVPAAFLARCPAHRPPQRPRALEPALPPPLAPAGGL